MTPKDPHREIERKFLTAGDGWRAQVVGEPVVMRAGYLSVRPESTVRVRIENDEAVLTIKGKPVDADGRERPEFNLSIPAPEAEAILASAMLDGGVIRKTRHTVQVGDSQFTVDVFEHPRPGLQLAEIELTHRDATFERPDWLGKEVTADWSYSNSSLASEA